MNSTLLRQRGLRPGYIVPSAHWSSIERICGTESSERSALLVEVPEEMRRAFEATHALGQSRLSTLRSGGGMFLFAITLQIGTCQTRVVLNLSEPHVRQYLQEATASGELLVGLHTRDESWVHSTLLAIEPDACGRLLETCAGAVAFSTEDAWNEKVSACCTLLQNTTFIVFDEKPASCISVVFVKDTSLFLKPGDFEAIL
ncbi:hypothetical protein [Paraburkholderia saeva]|uniref:Uncharacterized protein n=1 Tax=Paraburkholderia saeva TaxID=2777537 RepID=A0A9N8RSG5_9BURK|nr:hypothetical protein [Paraburkholderia saeva]CAG4886960.1 hypothetical protein LMG31841_00302 [Paraburkholderia saeva]CAG4887030.1 hypothetical protein R70241_00316 [Paraburkholderia saeva]